VGHLKERGEKNCLNCNAEVQGKFCHICGQENIHPKESAWHLLNHFFEDVTHFDGKFFSTIKLLITRPGFLSTAYSFGKRSSYLNPIRLYVFTSALFFLIFFTFIQKDAEEIIEKPATAKEVGEILNNKKAELQKSLVVDADFDDSLRANKKIKQIDQSIAVLNVNPDAADSIKNSLDDGLYGNILSKYSTKASYDSIQNKLPVQQKDNWVQRKFELRLLEAKIKYNGNSDKIRAAFMHKSKHSLPQILFLSLPFFALTLKLLYIRRKQFYYVNHIIFTIHLYCAVFILLLLSFGLHGLKHNLQWRLLNWVSIIISIGIFFYQYKAMRNFYLQSRLKTFIKYVLLNSIMAIIIIILILAMLTFTAYQI